ncbi:MAG: phycobilisome rod-core linker polypeptide, partial [Gemmatimonadetes bacterium]|nr:phycobilisome rod-core linker polypeptide [Gemmatimonadota bacterium]
MAGCVPAHALLLASMVLAALGSATPAAAQTCASGTSAASVSTQPAPGDSAAQEAAVPPPPGCDATPPEIYITPGTSSFSSRAVSVSISWRDNVGLNTLQPSHHVYLNGEDVTSSFSYSGTATSATSAGTIRLRAGENILKAEVWDQAANYSTRQVTYTYTAPPPVLPAPAPLPRARSGPTPTRQDVVEGIHFQILEREGYPGIVSHWVAQMDAGATVRQVVRAFVFSGEYTQRFVTEQPSARHVAALLYRHLFAREALSGELDYWGPRVASEGYGPMVDVLLNDPGYMAHFGEHAVPGSPVTLWDAARAPLVVEPIGVGPNLERDLCLTVAAGPGAAYECGDLRLAHALPALRTLNKVRQPVLLYNSQHAQPTPLVAARVMLPTDRGVPVQVDAELWVASSTSIYAAPAKRVSRTWNTDMAAQWAPGQARRIALQFDGSDLATGTHRYAMHVTATYPGGATQSWEQRGTLPVVNRQSSPYGAGWWVAGVEQIHFMDANRLFWVGGDGSTRLYEHRPQPTNWHVYVAPTPDRGLDTLRWNPYYSLTWTANSQGGTYERRLPGGASVFFDTQTGLHGATVNRLDHHTHFAYDGSARLTAIHVPTAVGYSAFKPAYRLEYGGPLGTLSRVTAPDLNDTPGRPLVLEHLFGDRRVTTLVDPDVTSDMGKVRFDVNHTSTTPYRITMRRQPRDMSRFSDTYYGYDAGGKLTEFHTPMPSPSAAIVTRLAAAETRGLGGAPVSPDEVFTLLNGPRDDVADARDHTAFWLDRFGAPWRIEDAAKRQTILTRSDPRFPALV